MKRALQKAFAILLPFLSPLSGFAAIGTERPLGTGIALPSILSSNPAGITTEGNVDVFSATGISIRSSYDSRGGTTHDYGATASLLVGGRTFGFGLKTGYIPPIYGSTANVPASVIVGTSADRISFGAEVATSFDLNSSTSTPATSSGGTDLQIDLGVIYAKTAKTGFGVKLHDLSGGMPRASVGMGHQQEGKYSLEAAVKAPPMNQSSSASTGWTVTADARMYVDPIGAGYQGGTTLGLDSRYGTTFSHYALFSLRLRSKTYLTASIPLTNGKYYSGGLVMSW